MPTIPLDELATKELPTDEQGRVRLREDPSNVSRTSDYPVTDEARWLVVALFEQLRLAEGALSMAEEDRRIAEEGTVAGYDSLPPA